MLSVFYLMGDVLVDRESGYLAEGVAMPSEAVFPGEEGSDAAGTSTAAAFAGEGYIKDKYFPHGEHPVAAIKFSAYAFIAAVFLPTVALLATLASISYLARLYGEEINLSRITRLV